MNGNWMKLILKRFRRQRPLKLKIFWVPERSRHCQPTCDHRPKRPSTCDGCSHGNCKRMEPRSQRLVQFCWVTKILNMKVEKRPHQSWHVSPGSCYFQPLLDSSGVSEKETSLEPFCRVENTPKSYTVCLAMKFARPWGLKREVSPGCAVVATV